MATFLDGLHLVEKNTFLEVVDEKVHWHSKFKACFVQKVSTTGTSIQTGVSLNQILAVFGSIMFNMFNDFE